jgi:ATP-dependent DNA helicase RecG
VDDLVNYFPFRYVDRSQYHTVFELPTLDGPAQLKGMIVHVSERQVGKQTRLIAKFQDRTGIIELVWFQGGKWIKPLLKLNTEFQVYGKAKFFGSNFTIPHPEIIEFEKVKSEKGLQAVYSSTENLNMNGLSSKGIAKITAQLIEVLKGKIPETLPESIVNDLRLMSREAALIQIHCPTDDARVSSARIRLKFEELFFLQLEMLMRKQISIRKTGGHIFPEVGYAFTEFYENHLPFQLTGAQKRVLKEIRKDFMTGHHMNRLLQGDVGSGKTLVALLTMLMGIGNGFQGALMAPTEILATQHFVTLSDILKNMDIKLELLTGSVGK